MNETRIVFKPSIARKMIKDGYQIIDLRPSRQKDGEIDFTRCTFIFGYKDGIDECIKKYTNSL